MPVGRGYRFLCGVPVGACTGATSNFSKSLSEKGLRTHSSSEEAFRCMRHHLLSCGYVQVGPRRFAPPDGGPIRVLTKVSHYGGRLRNGKEGTRHMPDEYPRVIVISC